MSLKPLNPIVATLVVSTGFWGDAQNGFDGEIHITRMGILLTWVIMLATLAVITLSWGEPAATGRRRQTQVPVHAMHEAGRDRPAQFAQQAAGLRLMLAV